MEPSSKTIREFSAGGVVFKRTKEKTLWLIIQPEGDGRHWSQGRWQFSKGMIEKGERAQETARREIEEETGAKAKIIGKVDTIRIFFFNEEKNRVLKTINFFLMEYQEEGKPKPDKEKIAAVAWLSYEEAHRKLTFDSEKKTLEKARQLLSQNLAQLALVV